MKKDKNKYRPVFWIVNFLTILCSGFFTIILLHQWFKIKILGYTYFYNFGNEGTRPYYYKSADLYSAVTFLWAIMFLAVLAFGAWSIIKRQRKKSLQAFGLTLLLIIAMMLHSKIGT